MVQVGEPAYCEGLGEGVKRLFERVVSLLTFSVVKVLLERAQRGALWERRVASS